MKMSERSNLILIVYSGPHKPQMVKLKEWLENNLPDYQCKLCTQFLLAWRIMKKNPFAVITYNKNLYKAKNVKALKQYTENGGKLITLHHNISSMMLKRPEWLEFTGIRIKRGEEAEYPWSVIEGGDLYMFNLKPDHPITTKDIEYTSKAPIFELNPNQNSLTLTYELNEEQKQDIPNWKTQPAIFFKKSEYFINHVVEPDSNRELLFGLYFNDAPSGRQFFSANGGWITKRGKGKLIYLMAGHSPHDYHETYCKIIRNCILY